METKEAKNVWIGITVIALILGVYYFGTASNNSNLTENTQDTSSVTQEQSAQIKDKEEIVSKSKCASDGKVFVQNYKQQYGSVKTVWQDPQFHHDTKLDTCLVFIGYVVQIYEAPLDLSNPNYSASLIVYNFVFDIYTNQVVLQNVANRQNTNGKNADSLSSYPNYSNIPNLEGDMFFNRLSILMNE